MTQHASLTAERWSSFDLGRQVLMIGNEMNRAARLVGPSEAASRRLAYERVLRLVDLTVEVQRRPTLRRELLRWRGLIGELYLRPDSDAVAHSAAFRALLQLTPVAARQIPYVLG